MDITALNCSVLGDSIMKRMIKLRISKEDFWACHQIGYNFILELIMICSQIQPQYQLTLCRSIRLLFKVILLLYSSIIKCCWFTCFSNHKPISSELCWVKWYNIINNLYWFRPNIRVCARNVYASKWNYLYYYWERFLMASPSFNQWN